MKRRSDESGLLEAWLSPGPWRIARSYPPVASVVASFEGEARLERLRLAGLALLVSVTAESRQDVTLLLR